MTASALKRAMPAIVTRAGKATGLQFVLGLAQGIAALSRMSSKCGPGAYRGLSPRLIRVVIGSNARFSARG